jgi:type I restriction enzyme S subunit
MEATATYAEIKKYTLEIGDVVITKDSETPGDIAVPALVADDLNGVVCGYHLAIIRPNKEKGIGEYLNYLLSMPSSRYYFFTLATGATRFGLSVGAIHGAELKLPTVAEQKAIAQVLCICDEEIDQIKAKLHFLKSEKKALMQQLLTGKRRVEVDEEQIEAVPA